MELLKHPQNNVYDMRQKSGGKILIPFDAYSFSVIVGARKSGDVAWGTSGYTVVSRIWRDSGSSRWSSAPPQSSPNNWPLPILSELNENDEILEVRRSS